MVLNIESIRIKNNKWICNGVDCYCYMFEDLHFCLHVNIITSVYTWILFICTDSYTNKHNIYMSTYQQEYSYLHYLLCTYTRVYTCTQSWLFICTHILVYIRPQFCQNTKTSNKLWPFPPFTAPSSVYDLCKTNRNQKKTLRIGNLEPHP